MSIRPKNIRFNSIYKTKYEKPQNVISKEAYKRAKALGITISEAQKQLDIEYAEAKTAKREQKRYLKKWEKEEKRKEAKRKRPHPMSDLKFGNYNIYKPVYDFGDKTKFQKFIEKIKKSGKKIRKHKGINQKTGRLNKGYKYSGKKLKNGLSQIVKV